LIVVGMIASSRVYADGERIAVFTKNQTNPYFRAPHIYVSIAARFWPGRRALNDEEIA